MLLGDLSSANDGQLVLRDVFFHCFYCLWVFSIIAFYCFCQSGMLNKHGFVVLDHFLPESMARQLADTARSAHEQKQMASGVLSTGDAWKKNRKDGA